MDGTVGGGDKFRGVFGGGGAWGEVEFRWRGARAEVEVEGGEDDEGSDGLVEGADSESGDMGLEG